MMTFTIRKAEKKILGAIALLFEAKFITNPLGLSKVIRGKEDEETSSTCFLRCFGYAPSLSNKAISRRLLSLEKKGLIEIRPYLTMEKAIFLTPIGEKEADKDLFPSASLSKRKKVNIMPYEGENE